MTFDRAATIARIETALYGPARLLDTTGFDAAPASLDPIARLFGMDDDVWETLTDDEIAGWDAAI